MKEILYFLSIGALLISACAKKSSSSKSGQSNALKEPEKQRVGIYTNIWEST